MRQLIHHRLLSWCYLHFQLLQERFYELVSDIVVKTSSSDADLIVCLTLPQCRHSGSSQVRNDCRSCLMATLAGIIHTFLAQNHLKNFEDDPIGPDHSFDQMHLVQTLRFPTSNHHGHQTQWLTTTYKYHEIASWVLFGSTIVDQYRRSWNN